MNDRGWEELVDLLDQRYTISDHKKTTEPLIDNHELTSTTESLVFEKDGDKYRVERITSPAIIDKKTFYRKVGTSEHTQYIYDPDETSSRVVFCRKSGNDWTEISPQDLLQVRH